MNWLCYAIAMHTPARLWIDWFPRIGTRAWGYYLTYPRNGEKGA